MPNMRQLTTSEIWRYQTMGVLPDDYIAPETKPVTTAVAKPAAATTTVVKPPAA